MRGVAFGPAAGFRRQSAVRPRFGLDGRARRSRPRRLRPNPGHVTRRRSGDASAEIATELGLGAALTLAELTSRWRDFVWRNHPDRQPMDAREQANARVAIANTLYDRGATRTRQSPASSFAGVTINATKRQ